MSELHSVVCMKVVPKPEEIRVDPKTHRLEREGARSEFNPPDMNALEMALKLKGQHAGRVTVLSMGPPFVEPYLRIALAMGADEAILLSDRDFAGADTLATTYTLAKAIEALPGVDLIFCGEESSDGATGQVPPGLAEWLDIALLSLATQVELNPAKRTLQCRREIKGGYEILESEMPAVVSVKTACNEPRFMDFGIKEWAFSHANIQVWDRVKLAADEAFIGSRGSPTVVTGLDQAESRDRKQIFLEGSPHQIAAQVVDLLREWL